MPNLQSTAPANEVVIIAQDNEYGKPFRGLSLQAAGAVQLVDAEGNDVTIPSGHLSAGMLHAISFTQIKSAGTDAGAGEIVGYR